MIVSSISTGEEKTVITLKDKQVYQRIIALFKRLLNMWKERTCENRIYVKLTRYFPDLRYFIVMPYLKRVYCNDNIFMLNVFVLEWALIQ